MCFSFSLEDFKFKASIERMTWTRFSSSEKRRLIADKISQLSGGRHQLPKLKFTKEEAEEASQDEVKILEEPEVAAPKKNELEMSIASITNNKLSDNVSAVSNLLQSAADSDRKRTVISQEETEKAVNAMLGESFDSFQGAADPANKQQVENMDEDVANVADDEAAAAVAGLAALGSPENTEDQWSRNQNAGKAQPEVTSAVEEKQMDESIENIAAEIRRSSTDSEDKSQEETSSSENGAKVPKSDKPVPMETSPAKEPATARRKSRDVFDFPDDDEEAAKPASIATSKVSPAAPSVENIIEEAVKADTKPQQTRVLPISRTAPPRTTSVTLTTASTLITPVSIVTTAPSSPAPVAAAEAATQSPLQPLRLSIDEKLSPSVSSSSPLSRSPKQRMRRSTGGNSRESEEESAVTEQKIHLILEQAKQEAERSAAAAAHHRPVVTMAGLHAIPMNLIAAGSQPELLIDPKTGQAVRGGVAGPSSSVTLSLVTSAAPPQAQAAQPEPARLVASGAKAGLPQPKEVVLPPRNDQQVPRPTTRVVPAAQVPPAAAVRQPLPIQLPTQPLPPESVRKTQPVLLEQNSAAAAKVAASVTTSVSTNLPRSVSLPTEPVPMSVASKMPSLPRTPLPMSTSGHVSGHVVVSTRSMSQPSSVSPSMTRQVVTTAAAAPPAVTQYLAQEQGQRVSLGKREEQEGDSKQKDQQFANEPLSLQSSQVKVQRDYLQPREREIHRSSSTPQPAQQEKDEKTSPQQAPSAHVYTAPGGHPAMFDSAGLDRGTLELLRLQADYKYRLELTQQLLARGFPEHMVPAYVEQLLKEKFIQEQALVQAAARTQQQHEPAEPRPGSVPPIMREMHHLEEMRQRQPLPAHAHQVVSEAAAHQYRSASPLYTGHYPPAHLAAPDHYRGGPPAAHTSAAAHRPSPSPGTVSDFSTRSRPTSPAPASYTLPHLAAYPICWTGTIGLKNEMANVRMHYVSGNRDLARASLPDKGSTLKIMQRMRLEDSQLDGVARKMETRGEHCVLLALPNGSEHEEIELQSRNLRHSFITYLQLKSAAGIVNVSNEDNQPAYIVHVFPSCDFANENLAR